jgi:hypothetical protein
MNSTQPNQAHAATSAPAWRVGLRWLYMLAVVLIAAAANALALFSVALALTLRLWRRLSPRPID